MHTVIVMPCLDEEASLVVACRSLGFGIPQAAAAATLVLVDNGSTDGTAAAMAAVAAASRPGSVRPLREAKRGHVPARCRGAHEAEIVSRDLGLTYEDVLLVQADADTRYAPGYVDALMQASVRAGPGFLVEGISEAPAEAVGWEDYHRLERAVDAATEAALGDMADDAVVDDKIAAFRLSDYLAWGGHRREYDGRGDEVLAETSRLFVRAKLRGGARIRSEQAVAVTSQRRTMEHPALAFATAGYPRTGGWVANFGAGLEAGVTLRSFDHAAGTGVARRLSTLRTQHLLGMFGLMPAWFAALDGRTAMGRPALDAAYAAVLRDAPARGSVADRPGLLFDWALNRPGADYLKLMEAARSDRAEASA